MELDGALDGGRRGVRAVIIGLVLPGAATLLATLPVEISTATAALAYVLAVTAAATIGGLVAGLAASILSFLALNVFFTPPLHTFVVTKAEDLIALVVFLLVSTTVGTLISTALSQRSRAERREREVRAARQEAETNRLRAALFSSVTHDLRTPLSSITASVTSLLDQHAVFSEEDRRELLETIRHEADRLNRVVGNLMDLSRIRAGAIAPSMSPASVDELVEGVVGRLEPTLRQHELVVSIPEDTPDVSIDIGQMDQVLTNLLENAARFTPAGNRIVVAVDAPDHVVRVRVEDEGAGVEAGDRERVFEPFVRGEGSPGTGLGLAIARAIVEAHGGRIWVEDGKLSGTSVVFELPRV